MTIDELKAQINSTIKSNGQRLITGAQLNSILNAIATYTAEVEGVSLKVPQFLPFDNIIANADVQVGSTSATDYEIVYVESKNVFTAYTGGVYYTDWVGSLSYNKGTFSKTAIATNLYINPYAEIYKIENSKLVAIQKYDIANVIATYGDGLATLSYKGSTIYPETKGSQVKLSIGKNAEDAIKQNGSNIVKEKERAQQVEMYLESQKANKYGYYENLSVGVSDNLSGRGEATESEFSFRPSGGENKSIPEDGTARINSIKGNSVVWNNLYSGNWYVAHPNNPVNVEKTEEGHIIFMPTSDNAGIIDTTIHSKVIGDKSALHVLVNESESDIVELQVHGYKVLGNSLTRSGKFLVYNALVERIKSDFTILRASIKAGNNGKSAEIIEVKFTNITKMFNGVNVPTTVEEFEALYGNMPNGYNEGTIIDNNTTAIKSVGVNAWDEEWENGSYGAAGEKIVSEERIRSKNAISVLPSMRYYLSSLNNNLVFGWEYDEQGEYIGRVVNGSPISNKEFTTRDRTRYIKISVGYPAEGNVVTTYNHDICIHLAHTGYLNGKYFPYESQTRQLPTVEGGLKSAGTAYDEIRYNKSKDKWEHVQRVGQVDLGTLDWELYNVERKVYAVVLKGELATKPVGDAICSNIYKYDYGSYATMADKSISLHPSKLNGNILLRNTDISSVSELKLSLKDVILNYELAKPVVTELDVDISPDYKVWDYGTEEAISEVLSTPIRINSNYGFNAVGQITDNEKNIENLSKEHDKLEAFANELDSTKADKNGYYENLSVGTADNLSCDNNIVETEFKFQASGGANISVADGNARINSIKGNSVVRNQFVKDPLFETENNTNWLYRGYSSYNVSNGTVEIVSNGNGECYIDQFFNFTKDHVYLFMCDVKGGDQQSGVRVYYKGASKVMANYVNKLNEWERIHVFVKTPVEETGGSRIRLYCTYSGNVTSYFRKPRLIDLTKMFNGVNVPTTVEEFEALYGNMPNGYNEGTIIDNNTTAIKSVGVNAWDEEWKVGALDIDNGTDISNNNTIRTKNFIPVIGGQTYYFGSTREGIENFYLRVACYDANKNFVGNIRYGVYPETSINTPNYNNPYTFDTNVAYIRFDVSPEYGTTYNHDICIHLVHTGYLNGRYFPYESQTRELPTVEGGLKSAGTAYDEIRYNKGKDKWEHVQRVGSVDLGTLSYEARGNSVFSTSDIVDRSLSGVFNAISSKYIVKKETTSTIDYVVNSSEDKFIRGYYLQTSILRTIYVKDTAYTDVATFKQAMQGVILYYELAEPIVTELDVDISPDYKVWDYGTEEAICEVLSTPVRINTNYGFNAVGQITDNTELIKELLARVAVLEAQVAQANNANVEPIEPIVE